METIKVKNISKRFRIGSEGKQNTLLYAISVFSGVEHKKNFWALKNISFTANAGEGIGLIGRNGSGKTTLLRTIAGVYKPDKGTIETDAKILLLSGVGGLLKLRLDVVNNIYLVGSILGLGQRDIKRHVNAIIAFAGLQKFRSTKIYQFSTGMRIRLSFSIVIHAIPYLKPDILLLDELFSGGDKEFKETSLREIEALMKQGITIMLASHRLDNIDKYCDRTIWLDKGRIAKQGKSREVIESYLKFIKKLKKNKNEK